MITIYSNTKTCPPCRAYEPIWREFEESVDYVDLDTEEGMRIAQEHGIKSIPTTIANGKHHTGALSREELVELINTK